MKGYIFRWDRNIDQERKLHTVKISILRRDFRDYFNSFKQEYITGLLKAKDAFEIAIRAPHITPGLRGLDKPLQSFTTNLLTNDYVRQLFNIPLTEDKMAFLQPIIDFIRQLKSRLRDLEAKRVDLSSFRELYETEIFHQRFSELLELSRRDIPDIYTNIEIGICRTNFHSGQKRDCDLLEYHSITMGANCPYVGFLDKNFSPHQASEFRYNWERTLMIISPSLIAPTDDIKIIGDDDYFTYKIPKNRRWEVAKLEVAYQREQMSNELSSANMGEQTDIAEDWKSEARGTAVHKETPVSGEYIAVGNIDIPCLVINASIPSGKEIYYDEISKIHHNKYETAIEADISNELIDSHRRQSSIISNGLVRFLIDWLSGGASSTSRFVIHPEYIVDGATKSTGNIVDDIEGLMRAVVGGRRRSRRRRKSRKYYPRLY